MRQTKRSEPAILHEAAQDSKLHVDEALGRVVGGVVPVIGTLRHGADRAVGGVHLPVVGFVSEGYELESGSYVNGHSRRLLIESHITEAVAN